MRLFLSVRPEDTICYRVAEENNVLFLLVLWAGGGVVILTLQSFSVVGSDFCTSSRFKQKPELFTLKIYIKKEFIRKCCFQHEWLSNQRQTSTGEHSQITWWETALCFFMEQCCTSGFCHLTFSQRNEAVCWLLQLVNSQNNRRNDNLHTSVNMRACLCVCVYAAVYVWGCVWVGRRLAELFFAPRREVLKNTSLLQWNLCKHTASNVHAMSTWGHYIQFNPQQSFFLDKYLDCRQASKVTISVAWCCDVCLGTLVKSLC